MEKNNTSVEQPSFYLHNGEVLRSLNDLIDYAPQMPVEVFNHHVNNDRNDFANWIKEAIGNTKLATSIKRVKKYDSFVKKLSEEKK